MNLNFNFNFKLQYNYNILQGSGRQLAKRPPGPAPGKFGLRNDPPQTQFPLECQGSIEIESKRKWGNGESERNCKTKQLTNLGIRVRKIKRLLEMYGNLQLKEDT